ncbi:MAG: type II toxin-antitoxin system RelE/ParE family toxin [Nitrospirota bacterium]|nr:type II toxin-antitoxin system RelE/ParE family toxin [Nitrospirota bacterium]
MGNYRISEDAKEDLKRIYKRGLCEYGEAKADKYYLAFFDRFERLAEQPFLYQAVDHIRKGYRRSVCGVDSIYYRIEGDTVEIMNILGSQDTGTIIQPYPS